MWGVSAGGRVFMAETSVLNEKAIMIEYMIFL